ncbi:hypothetical protein GCM10027399_20780 [Curvibacter fontanus]
MVARTCGGILQQHALAVALRQDEHAQAAIFGAHQGQGRQGRERKPLDCAAGELGLQTQMLGSLQQIVQLEWLIT